MKLHLPKLLLTAVLAAGMLGSQYAVAEEYTIGTDNNADSRITSATSEDTIIFNKEGGYLTRGTAEGGKEYNTINAAVQIEKLILTNAYSDNVYTFTNSVSGTGDFSFTGTAGGNNQHYVFEGDMSNYSGNMSIAANKYGTFTFKGISVGATSISANQVQFTDGASTASTINVNNGHLLIVGHEGTGNYSGEFQGQSVNMSAATVNLKAGGTVRFNGDSSYIGTLNAEGGNLHLEDGVATSNGSGDTAGGGLNITTLNISSNLTVTNTWKGSLDIGALTGTGELVLNTKNGGDIISVKINSVAAGVHISSNAGALILGDTADSVINLSGTIANTGNITLNGKLAISSEGVFKVYESASGGSYSHGDDGYYISTGSKFYAIQGSGSFTNSGSVTLDGVDTSLSAVDDGYVFTAGEFTDLSTFYIKSSKVTANAEGYADIYGASTYIIDAGKELDVNGQYFAGKAFVLGEGATLSNTGVGLNGNNRMFQSIELTGDAYVDGTSNMGLLAFNSADAAAATSTLKLNGHTLTQKSDASFFLTGTTVEGSGTIKIQAGTLQVGIEVNHANNADTSAEGVDFVLAGGTLTILEGGNILTAKSLSGDGTVTGSGTLKLNNTGTAEERTITGNVSLGSLELTGNDNYTITGNLNVTGYTLLNAGDVTLGAGTHLIGRLDLSKGNASDSTLILENGAQVTVTTDLWVGSNAGITIKEGAALTKGNVKMEALSSTTNATIAFLATSGDQFSAGNANYAYNNAKVSVTTSDAEGGDVTFSSKLVNSEIVNSGAGNLTVNNSENTLTAVTADAGNVKIVNSSTEQVSIGSITAAAGKTVSAEVADLNVGTLTLGDSASTFTTTGSLTIGELVLDLSKYTDMSQTYTLVTTTGEGATVGLSTAYSQEHNGYTATVGGSGTGSLTLSFSEIVAPDTSITTTVSSFGGIADGMLTLNVDAGLADVTKVLITGISDDIMKQILGNSNLPTDGMVGITLRDKDGVEFPATPDQVVGFQGKDGIYYGEAGTGNVGWVYQAAYIPEPTTATLSLLALAGLAMRRRRK